MNTLKAEKRSMDIKAKKLRREGFVTGNVFGKKLAESIPVKIEKSAIEKLLKTSHKGSQIMLDIDGESYQVLIKDVEYNPLKGQVDKMTSWEFFDYLLENANVVGTPGSGFGPSGEGYFRLTAFGSYENTVAAIERIKAL